MQARYVGGMACASACSPISNVSVAIRVRLPCALVLPLLAGCGGYQRYTPVPLGARQHAASYEQRSLADPVLLHFLAENGLAPTDSGWSSKQLALAAIYERPDLDQARAAVREAQAAEVTAGVTPPPSVAAAIGRADRTDRGKSSPWTVSLAAGLTLELGGKRAARTERARAAVLAATLRLQALAWTIASATRSAAVTSINADRDLASAVAEATARRTLLGLLRSRYAEGQLSRVELARAEADYQAASVGITEARRTRTNARLALARSLAVPLVAIDSLRLQSDAHSGCATLDSVPPDTLRALALRHRYDLGAALADYAVVEGDLRLAIAQQYPDFTVEPGISWDQGIVRWLLSVAVPAIPVARNRGPIAAAAAVRGAEAARAVSSQDSVLAGVDSSIVACREFQHALIASDSLVSVAEHQVRLAQAAYLRGETGAVDTALARIALVRAERVRVITVGRGVTAGVALESAVGMSLAGPQNP
jgi:cobalt-zinc-cadmium efflux system outer membrane protein